MTNIFDMLKGNRMYNLEIKIDEKNNNFSVNDLKNIEKYLGTFGVTELGYLTNRNGDALPDRTAEIRGYDFLDRGIIHFKDNNEMDAIIKEPFLGFRLMQFIHKKEKIENRRYQPAGLALA